MSRRETWRPFYVEGGVMTIETGDPLMNPHRSVAERTPKRRRRIGYQGKRKKPGSGGGPHRVSDVARDRARKGWLGRAKKNQPSKTGAFGGGLDMGIIAAMLARMRGKTSKKSKPWGRP